MNEVPFVPLGAADAIRLLLKYIGEDPTREGLIETPKRVISGFSELFSGYGKDPALILKTFLDGACDEMVVLKDIEFGSFCEHHLLPFTGKAHIGYMPDGKIVGISKLVRLLEIYTKRLQIQERITTQVTLALDEYLQPKGSACVLEATHGCMQCRGVKSRNSIMVTSSLTGLFRERLEVRQEFFHLIRG